MTRRFLRKYGSMQRKVFTLFVMLCGILISRIALSNPNIELAKIVSPAKGHLFVYVSQLASSAEVSIVDNGQVIRSQKIPNTLGVGAFIYLGEGLGSQQLSVQLSRQFYSTLPVTATVKVIETSAGQALTRPLIKFSSLLSNWAQQTNEHRLESLQPIKILLDQLSPAESFNYGVTQTYLAILLELEQYETLFNLKFPQENNANNGLIANLDLLNYSMVAASARQTLRQFDLAAQEYKSVYEVLSALPVSSLSAVWQIRMDRIYAGMGETLFLHAAHIGDSVLLNEGANVLRKAMSAESTPKDPRLLARIQNTYAFYLWNSGQREAGTSMMNAAVANHTKAGKSTDLVSSLNNLAVFHNWRGDMGEAIRAMTRAVTMQNTFQPHSEKGYLSVNLADLYMSVGEYELAEMAVQSAYHAFDQVDSGVGKAVVNHFFAKLRYQTKDYQRAAKLFAASIAWYQSSEGNSEANALLVYQQHAELAQTYLKLDQLHKAELVLTKTDDFLQRLVVSHNRGEYADEAKLIGLLMVHLELVRRKGEDHKYREIEAQLTQILERSIDKSSFPVRALNFYSVQLQYYAEKKDHNRVAAEVQNVDLLLEQLQAQLELDVLAPALARKFIEFYDLYAQHLSNEARVSQDNIHLSNLFYFLEKRSAVNLFQSREKSLAEFEVPSGKENVNSENSELTAFAEAHAVNASTNTAQKLAVVEVAEQRAVLSSESKNFPIQSASESTVAKPISELQNELAPGDLLLRYFVQQRTSLLFAISASSWEYLEIGDRQEILKTSSLLKSAVVGRSGNVVPLSSELAELLGLNDIGLDGVKNIILVADGVLAAVPFSAINLSTTSYQPLGSKHRVVRAANLSQYYSDKPSRFQGSYENDLAIFADPDFSNSTLAQQLPAVATADRYRSWSTELQRLPWTAQEADALQEIFAEKTVAVKLGKAATSEALLSDQMLRSKVLHIASHGYFSEQTPGIVGLATAQNSDERDSDPGFVSLTKLLAQSFAANLVVVSGCETSLGSDLGNEGLNGLTRGLMAKGAGSVIGTLWPVADRASAIFMGQLYRNLKLYDGDVGMALQQTRSNFANTGRYKHPFYWAGYVLISANKIYDENVFH